MFITRHLIERVELTSARLGQRAIEAMVAAGASGATWESCDGGALIAMGSGRFVNRALGIGLGGTDATTILDHVEDFFDRQGLVPCVEVCPWARDLIQAMTSRGYIVDDVRELYVHDLHSLPARSPMEIREVPDDKGLEGSLATAWTEILASNHPRGSAEWHRDVEFFRVALQIPQRINVAALIEGMPSSTGSLSIVDTVGEFGGATTLATQRRKGCQQALIAERLHRAKEVGCDLAIVVAMPASTSARNLQRAGFQLLFNPIVMRRR